MAAIFRLVLDGININSTSFCLLFVMKRRAHTSSNSVDRWEAVAWSGDKDECLGG
jgi:hypothetical protein